MTTADALTAADRPRRITGRRQLPPILIDAALVWMICGAFLGVLGPLAPLMVMTGAGALFVLAPSAWPSLVKAWPMLIVAAIPPLSALWSDEPAISFRYGIQLTVTVAAVVIAAAATGPTRYVRGLFIGGAIILALCILSGRQGQSQGGAVLIGVLGSKNAMGHLCMLVVSTSLAMFLSPTQPALLRKAAIGIGLVGLLVLLRTFATGAALALVLFLAVFITLATASKLAASAKFLLLVAVVIALAPLWFVQADLVRAYEWFLVDVLNKDVGLTGRDYLWRHADALISSKPVLGHGYRAIWLGQGSETIGLLRWAGLESGLGFNFHNTFRESLVDFGIVGSLGIFVVLGIGFGRLLMRAISRPTDMSLIFLATIGIVMIAKSYAETLIGAFGDPSLLVFGVSVFGFLLPHAPRSQNVRMAAGRGPL